MKGQKIKKLLITACIVSPLVLFGVVAVLANYTGPNRTVTTTVWERQNCQYRAYVASPSGYCYLTLYYPPSSCPSTSSVAGYFSPGPLSCGSSWPGTCGSSISCIITQLNNSTEGCSSGQPGCTSHTSTTTYPPATVSGTTGCTLPGNAGWCRGTATLNLSGNEPLAPSYSLTFFEGSLGNLCDAPSCTWTFPEGNTIFNYWVHSTFGDTSTMASASMLVDSIAPTLTLTIPPPDGANGWFISGHVNASTSATDATSSVSGSPSINGGGASFTATTDGIYNLTATVSDVAGNTASSNGTIRLDTTPPSLSVEGNPTSPDGSNNWYVSPVILTGTASDATSGVAGMHYQVDGGSWQNGSSLSEGVDGTHTIVFRTMDNAGNTATSVPMTVSIDRTAPIPDASLSPLSPDGANGWYVSPVTLTASSSDATSGLASQGVSLDGTTWTPNVTVSSDGTTMVQVYAKDNAGNTASSTKTIRLDTTPPTASILLPLSDGNNGWHVTPVTVTAGGTDVTSGVESLLVSLDGNTWAPSLTLSADGVYTVQARATDNAGNATIVSQTIPIDRTPPDISPPVLTGTTGLAGWYTSSVGLSVSATDAMSGVASTQYSVDGGTWQTTAPTLLDGVHIVQIRVTDNAGNSSSTSASVNLDATPPVSTFISPAEGSTTRVSGNQVIHMTGSNSDPTSGISGAEISLDGGTTWQSLPLGPSGAWSEDWNSLRGNGTYTIEVRASDQAGNQEHTARITIVVGNQAPRVSITPVWFDFGSASVSFNAGSLPIAGARITVSDPQGRWPNAVFEYSGSNLPTKFSWLGRMGDGSIAYAGKYYVTARVWDSFGNSGSADGWVIIPLPPAKATPTVTPTAAEPTATPAASSTPIHPTATPAATPTPTIPIPTAVTAVPVSKPAPVSGWPAAFTGSLLVLFLSLSLLDPRPAAWRRLARIKSNPNPKS